jgi:hypothetical protein
MHTAPVGDHDAAPPLLPALGAALPAAVAIVGAVGISLAAAQAIGLSDRATASWLLVQFGLPGALGVALTRVWRQPLLFIPTRRASCSSDRSAASCPIRSWWAPPASPGSWCCWPAPSV